MIHGFLSKQSYWAQGRSLEAVQKSINNSLCFGLHLDGEQIGFARVVTDYTIYAWLMDIFILQEHRGKGFGTYLVRGIKSCKELKTIKRWGLCTEDAHELYKKVGFQPLEKPELMMEITNEQ